MAVDGFAQWRSQARSLLAASVPPDQAHWDDDSQLPVIAATPADGGAALARFRIPSALYELLQTAACHRDPRRPAVMYRLLWRVTHGEPRLLDDAADDDVHDVARMAKAVRLDSHKMTAFVRFREVRDADAQTSVWIAWYEPVHRIVARTAPFFVDRFASMTWTIVTPDGIAHWNRRELALQPYDASAPRPTEDAKEALWLAYYRSIFNPARLNVRAMQKEMPQRYWAHLPEARCIPALVATAVRRTGAMVETVSERGSRPAMSRAAAALSVRAGAGLKNGESPATAAGELVSAGAGLPARADIDGCRRCPLWERATQGVCGRGDPAAGLMLIGEQPGDAEDLAGEPFVGPAGKLLQSALAAAGVAEHGVYITNAVKHFNWEPRGKRRIHKTPTQQAIAACRHWLDQEILRVGPRVIVALGVSALVALTGERRSIAASRASPLRFHGGQVIVATYHPAAILRAADEATRNALLQALIDDLRHAAALIDGPRAGVATPHTREIA
jgi:DNA polymerase